MRKIEPENFLYNHDVSAKNLKDTGIPELIICRKGMYYLDVGKTESDYASIMAIKGQLENENWTELWKMPDIRELYGGAYLEFCTEEWTYGIRLIWDALYSSV